MISIGIDPGVSGAVAVLYRGSVVLFDTPTFLVEGKTTSRRTFDVPAMRQIFRDALERQEPGEGIYAHLEAVTAMPSITGPGPRRGMGATSAFSFGRGVGLWEGLLVGLGIPYTRVHPARWKKVMMDGEPKEKGASILVAKRLFPNLDLNRKKDHGRADALLIAEYGRRTTTGRDELNP